MSARFDPSRLFHAIVVVGTAMAEGCGGRVVFESASGSGTGGTGSTHGSTAAHATSVASSVATTDASTSTGDPCQSVPVSSCASPAQYHCVDCGGGFHNKCTCDTTAPEKPTDCATTADFHCTSWNPPTDCHCVPGSPTSAAQCPTPQAWSCAMYMPPVGCVCVVPIM